ncbi:hypothetical protein ACRALDRAFT_206978 [Sodiomyces alcalophilus JCM 7366]|uniref:uncharacterized protein n=1 Tax=Sodiomyces alcalophilus JCM 7366 TaxID=591952 RepID=UPI0039B6B523
MVVVDLPITYVPCPISDHRLTLDDTYFVWYLRSMKLASNPLPPFASSSGPTLLSPALYYFPYFSIFFFLLPFDNNKTLTITIESTTNWYARPKPQKIRCQPVIRDCREIQSTTPVCPFGFLHSSFHRCFPPAQAYSAVVRRVSFFVWFPAARFPSTVLHSPPALSTATRSFYVLPKTRPIPLFPSLSYLS